MNLANPASSRLVVKLILARAQLLERLRRGRRDAAAAIQAWADAVNYGSGGVSVDGALASSAAVARRRHR